MIYLLQELENSASSDAAVREKIASLPPEVSDINLLARLEGKVDYPSFRSHYQVCLDGVVTIYSNFKKRD